MTDTPPTSTVVAIVEATLRPAEGVAVKFDDRVEVTLDCPMCGRTRRTVVFALAAREARCTPTGHAFPGRVEGKSVSAGEDGTTVAYRIRYDTARFLDPKYNEPSVPHPTWGRVGLILTCLACGRRQHASFQNNVRRPRTHCCERCHRAMFEETEEMPRFRLLDEAGAVLYRQDRSTFVLRLRDFGGLPDDAKAELCGVLGLPPRGLARLAGAGQPLYEQDAYGIEDPLRFGNDLRRMAFALLRCRADFDLLHNGRDLKPSYRRRMEGTGNASGG